MFICISELSLPLSRWSLKVDSISGSASKEPVVSVLYLSNKHRDEFYMYVTQKLKPVNLHSSSRPVELILAGFNLLSSNCSRVSRGIVSRAFLWVASNLTSGADPAVKASYHLVAQSAHLSPGFKPKQEQ